MRQAGKSYEASDDFEIWRSLIEVRKNMAQVPHPIYAVASDTHPMQVAAKKNKNPPKRKNFKKQNNQLGKWSYQA